MSDWNETNKYPRGAAIEGILRADMALLEETEAIRADMEKQRLEKQRLKEMEANIKAQIGYGIAGDCAKMEEPPSLPERIAKKLAYHQEHVTRLLEVQDLLRSNPGAPRILELLGQG